MDEKQNPSPDETAGSPRHEPQAPPEAADEPVWEPELGPEGTGEEPWAESQGGGTYTRDPAALEAAARAWKRVQLARHAQRPHSLDFITRIFTGFQEIHGDRLFGEDAAIVCGFALFDGEPVLVIGQQKGRDTKQKLHRNWGMPKPEGYRKALRAMRLAEKFRRPIFTFLDTPGAYPGIDAEERGQAEAIARNLLSMAQIRAPIIVTCIAEGGSGGALALGVGNRILMLENAIYSVISPESCAAIVWRDVSKAELAASALRLTAEDLLEFQIIDEVVPEPHEGAHTDHAAAAALLASALRTNLRRLKTMSEAELVEDRLKKFRTMGSFFESAT
jgi:acetyl-CoA carboxylase carboxyl transferase subunit alpha